MDRKLSIMLGYETIETRRLPWWHWSVLSDRAGWWMDWALIKIPAVRRRIIQREIDDVELLKRG